jgi:hypothetical protein
MSEFTGAVASPMRYRAGDAGVKLRRPDMKTIVASALITLSLLTTLAAPAGAFDSKEFWEQQDRLHY